METKPPYNGVRISDWHGESECFGNTACVVDGRATTVSSRDCRTVEFHAAAGGCVGPQRTMDGVETDHQSVYEHVGISRAVLEDQHDCACGLPCGRFARVGRRVLSRRGHFARSNSAGANAANAGLRIDFYV